MSRAEVIAGPVLILRGRISDALTGAGLAAHLTLSVTQSATRALPAPRLLPGGWFALALPRAQLSALCHLNAPATFRLRAEAAGHDPVEGGVTASPLALAPGVVPVADQTAPAPGLAGGPLRIDLALMPRAVMLAGRVISDGDPTRPVPRARVTITGSPAVTADDQGRFRFDAPPRAVALSLTVRAGTRRATALHLTDFSSPVNFVTLSLPPA